MCASTVLRIIKIIVIEVLAFGICYYVGVTHWGIIQKEKENNELTLKKRQCLRTKDDSYTYKNWCDQPLASLK